MAFRVACRVIAGGCRVGVDVEDDGVLVDCSSGAGR